MKLKQSCLFKALGILFALSLPLTLASAVAMAASYPTKPVRIIAPYAPGGSSDILGRLMAASLTERLGKQVIVENRPGAGSIIGTEAAAKAEANGYTLLVITGGHTVQPAFQKLPYDAAKSFTPLAMIGTGPFALTVHSSFPAKSVKEFITLAKQKPGEVIFACSGTGGSSHMAIELLKMMADIDVKILQFKGGGPALIDHVGGHSHAAFLSLVQPYPHIQSGKLRLLGVGGAKRSGILPDTPTIAEGGVPGYEMSQWYGMLAPAGLPGPIVERLTNEIKVILTSAELKKRFLREGTEAEYMGPGEFGKFLEKDIAKWIAVAKKANIKLEQ